LKWQFGSSIHARFDERRLVWASRTIKYENKKFKYQKLESPLSVGEGVEIPAAQNSHFSREISRKIPKPRRRYFSISSPQAHP
jgi:hypothetical protein